jgi:hypothetical protein
MKKLFMVLTTAGLISCSQPSEINKQLSGSDSLVINFNQPGSDTISKTMTSTDGKAIDQLVNFTDTKRKEVGPCPFDGNLVFYKQGSLKADVAFSYSTDSCRMFVMKLGEKYVATEMSNNAIDFLKGLREGRAWY